LPAWKGEEQMQGGLPGRHEKISTLF